MDELTQTWDGLEGATGWALLGALLIVGAAVPVAWAAGRLTTWGIRRLPGVPELSARTGGRVVQSLLVLIFIAWALSVLGVGPGWTAVVALFLVGIGILVAEPILANMAASLRLPFEIGDQIGSAGHEGTVLDITASRTVLLTVDQRRVGLPNTDIMAGPLVVFTATERRRSSVEIGVDNRSDLEAVAALLVTAASTADGVHQDPPPYVIPNGYARDANLLLVKFWHDPDLKSAELTPGAVVAALTSRLGEAGIAIRGPEVFLQRE